MSIPLDVVLVYDGTSVDGSMAASVDVSASDMAVPKRELGDAALVAGAKRGDFSAFEELVRRYRNEVFALCYHFVRDREEAWDISQEVFIKAYRAVARFRGEASFKTWLMRIATNQCKDFFKKRRLDTVRLEEAKDVEDAPSRALGPEEVLEAREMDAAISDALGSLPVRHRTAFVLREFEGLSYEQMARVMGCRLGTVMSRLHHARRKLQNALVRSGIVEVRRHE